MPRLKTLAAACSVVAVGSAIAGLALAHQQPSFRAGVQAVTIEVGVLDERGMPIPDLNVGDFTVTVEGHPRRVVSASFVSAAVAERAVRALPISTNDGIGGGRLVLFLVDQSTLDRSSAGHVATAAARFLSRLTANDRSALVMMPVGTGVPFTADHDRVLKVLQGATGLGMPASQPRGMSLEEVRAIAVGDVGALENIAARQCPAGGQSGLGGSVRGGGRQGASGAANTGSLSGGLLGPGGAFGAGECMRRIEFEARSAWQQLNNTTLASLAAFRAVLNDLKKVAGEKTVILVTGGWPLEARETSVELAPIAALAGDAHVTVYALSTVASENAADRGTVSMTPVADEAVRAWSLESLASLTGGAYFRADVGAAPVFDRLARELSGAYRIGVEQAPADLDGKARPLQVQVSRRGATVRAPGRFTAPAYSARDLTARLDAALAGPLPATGLNVRLTSYVVANTEIPGADSVLLAGDVTGVRPGTVRLQLLVQDTAGKAVATGVHSIGPAAAGWLPFSTSIALQPGTYSLRAAIVDATGSVGSVDRTVDVRRSTVGPLTVGDLVLARVPAGRTDHEDLVVDAISQDEGLELRIDLAGDRDHVAAADVLFEIADADEQTLVRVEPTRASGAAGGWAKATADLGGLAPGVYLARARIAAEGASAAIGRPFVVVGHGAEAPDRP